MFSGVRRAACYLAPYLCLASQPVLAASYHYTTLAVPGAVATAVTGLNSGGMVVGNWEDGGLSEHGYVWQNGQFTTIDPPGSVFTLATGINDAGTIVGTYQSSDFVFHGFIYSAGKFTIVDSPNSTFTELVSINSSGQITGDMLGNGIISDFLYQAGIFTTILAKGTPFPVAINAAGKVIGTYSDKNLDQFGYSYASGKLSPIPIANSSLTNPDGVNASGAISGYYFDTTTSSIRGFTYDRHKTTIIDTPGQAATFVYNLNDAGLVIGNAWSDTPLHAVGFVLDHGVRSKIKPPAGSSVFPSYINASGTIAGSYTGPDGNEVFLATP